jgi:hypothetical protein
MFVALIFIIGSGIAASGFLVMRNPMRLTLLARGAEVYYQRMILDRSRRNQLRIVGMIISFFGLVILSVPLRGLRLKIFDTLSEGFLVLLWFSFISAFAFGVINAAVQLVRGRGEGLFDGFRMRRQGIELGPIAVYPAITPRMCREAKAFTIVYCLLVALTFVVALIIH